MQTACDRNRESESVPGEKTIIHFPDGIYGFETIKDFILIREDEHGVIWSLRAADSPYPSLVAVDPFLVIQDYRPELNGADLRALGSPAQKDLGFLAVAVIRKNLPDSVVNLKSPIAVSVKNHLGRQVILEDSDYPVRYRLFQSPVKGV